MPPATKLVAVVAALLVRSTWTAAILADAASQAGSRKIISGRVTGPACCFSENCQDWSLFDDSHTLNSTCVRRVDNRHGNPVISYLDLNHCISNQDDTLIAAAGGSFGQSCSNCAVSGTILSCICPDTSSKASESRTDLNTFVSDNFNTGVLECFDILGVMVKSKQA